VLFRSYIEIARRIAPQRVDAIVRRIVPRALTEVEGSEPAWPRDGQAFFEARKELFEILRNGS